MRLTSSGGIATFSGDEGSRLTGTVSLTDGLRSFNVIPTNPRVNQSAALLPAVTSLISLFGVAGVVGGARGTTVLGEGETFARDPRLSRISSSGPAISSDGKMGAGISGMTFSFSSF